MCIRDSVRGVLFSLLAGASWGFSGTVGQYLFTEKQMDSGWLTVVRMLASGVILLAAANRIIIPVQAEYLPAKGLEQLLSTVNKVKRQINPIDDRKAGLIKKTPSTQKASFLL